MVIGHSFKGVSASKKYVLPKIKRTCAFDAKILGFSDGIDS
jgi:hypothetical protein